MVERLDELDMALLPRGLWGLCISGAMGEGINAGSWL